MQTRWNPSHKAAAGILIAMSMYLPAAALAAERSFDRTLTVNGPVTLHVSTGSGYIHVSPGSDNQVHIVGHVKSGNSWWGGNSDDAVSRVANNPPINQAGNIIRVGEGSDDFMRHVSDRLRDHDPGQYHACGRERLRRPATFQSEWNGPGTHRLGLHPRGQAGRGLQA